MSKITDEARTVADNLDDYSANSIMMSHGIAASMTVAAKSLRTLANIVDRLPVTADGVPVVWNQSVWWATASGGVQEMRVVIPRTSPCMNDVASNAAAFAKCYSTREAAEAATRLANGPHDHDHLETPDA